jgi:hypothetical protein
MSTRIRTPDRGQGARPGRQRKPPEPVRGNARWLKTPPADWSAPGLLIISTATGANTYSVAPVWSGHGLHFGRQIAGFALEKQGTAEVYHIALEPWGMECDCPDGQFRGAYATVPEARGCKHAVALKAALAAIGRLPEAPAVEPFDAFARIA